MGGGPQTRSDVGPTLGVEDRYEKEWEDRTMFKLTLRYSRYALTALASVGFKIVLN